MNIIVATLPWGDSLTISANLAEASSPIEVCTDPEEERWESTPYQTADARHNEVRAVRLVLSHYGPDFFADPNDDRDVDEILDEVMAKVKVSHGT